jgi:NADH-quinone oxidoreductase subunit H
MKGNRPRGHHFTDQLMRLRWKVFLPLSLEMVVIVASVLQFAGIAPK